MGFPLFCEKQGMRDFSHNLRKNFLAGTIFGIFPHFQLFPFSFYPCCEILGFDGSKFYSERISRQKFPVNSCFLIPKSLPSWSIPMVFFWEGRVSHGCSSWKNPSGCIPSFCSCWICSRATSLPLPLPGGRGWSRRIFLLLLN